MGVKDLQEIINKIDPSLEVKMTVNTEYLVRVRSAKLREEIETGEKYLLLLDY